MSFISDLAENLKNSATQLLNKVQESSLFQKAKERFESLPAFGQKAVLGLLVVSVTAFVLSFPLSSYWSASDSIASFEDKRNLIQDLFRVNSEGQASLPVDPPPPIENLRIQIESRLKQSQLTAEQIRGINLDSIPQSMAQESVEGALSVSLVKLNLRQVVDIGYAVQSISTGIKMLDLTVQANISDAHYFDVVYKLITLKVPDFSTLPEPEPSTGNRKLKKPAPSKKTDEDT